MHGLDTECLIKEGVKPISAARVQALEVVVQWLLAGVASFARLVHTTFPRRPHACILGPKRERHGHVLLSVGRNLGVEPTEEAR
jgi:hypothetical protein